MRLPLLAEGQRFSPAEFAGFGWTVLSKPPAAGHYERLTAFGPVEYFWDGRWWWTLGSTGGRRCRLANQALPWRPLPGWPPLEDPVPARAPA